MRFEKLKLSSLGMVFLLVFAGFTALTIYESDIATAETLYVGGTGSGNYSSIQNAIDDASDGDTVYVYNGIYNESITIDKGITIKGENRQNTTINGSLSGKVVKINADNVNITRLNIENGSYGIFCEGDSALISNNMISNQDGIDGSKGEDGHKGVGIYVRYGSYNVLKDNKIVDVKGGKGGMGYYANHGKTGGVSAGIYITSSVGNLVLSNNISGIEGGKGGTGGKFGSGGAGGLATGIYLTSTDNNEISSNQIFGLKGGSGGKWGDEAAGGAGGVTTGIRISSSTKNEILANRIHDLQKSSGGEGGYSYDGADGISAGIWLDRSSFNNELYNLSGTIINRSSLNRIEGRPILYSYNKTGLKVKDFNVTTSSTPILIGGSVKTGNPGGQNGLSTGIALIKSKNTTVSNNTISGFKGLSGGTGGYLGSGGAGGISTGIYLSNSFSNDIKNNSINDLTGGSGGTGGHYGTGGTGGISTGIYISTSRRNNITSNEIYSLNDGEKGIRGRYGSDGAGGHSSGIWLDRYSYNNELTSLSGSSPDVTKLNRIDGAPILYFHDETGLNVSGLNITTSCTPILIGGESDTGGEGGQGGLSVGLALIDTHGSTFSDITISGFDGMNGGSGRTDRSGGAGGNTIGIYISSSTYNHISTNNISGLTAGNGGTGGHRGSGGVGGVSVGFSFSSSINNRISSNNIDDLSPGNGGISGGGGSWCKGAGGCSAGMWLDSSLSYDNKLTPLSGDSPNSSRLNRIENDPILYFHNRTELHIENFSVTTGSIPILIGGSTETGLHWGYNGLSTGMAFIKVQNATLNNNTISGYKGMSGGTGSANGEGGKGGNCTGMYMAFSTNNTVFSNSIWDLRGGTGGTGGCTADGGDGGSCSGIYIKTSSGENISSNYIHSLTGGKGGDGGTGASKGSSGISAGLHILDLDNGTILKNTISENQYGIYLKSSTNNSIYQNNFINNPSFDDGDNTWNRTYPEGGNYWSSYGGYDNYSGPGQNRSGSDGIGDTPYSIDGGSNNDTYPLMTPVGPPRVKSTQPQNQATNVTVNKSVTIVFNESLNSTITPDLDQSTGSTEYIFAGWNSTYMRNDTATWTHEDWSSYSPIELTVSGYKDTDGESGKNYTWSFKTEDITPPTARIPDNRSVSEDTLITFNGSDSSDNVGIINYTWTIQGTQFYGEKAQYTFQDPGIYEVRLNVSDGAGNWDTDICNVTVNDTTSPTAEAGPDRSVDEDTMVTFNGSNSTDNIEITNYTWAIQGSHQYGEEVHYTFSQPGTYVVSLNVSDEANNWDIDTCNVEVNDTTSPNASAGPNQTVMQYEVVTLNGSDSTDNNEISNYTWTIQGEHYYGEIIQYRFSEVDSYIVTLNVTDDAGNYDLDICNITVIPDLKDPDADAGEDKIVEEDTSVILNGSASSDNVGITNYTWIINGTEIYGEAVEFTFTEPSIYVVVLNVTDGAKNYDTDTCNVTVKDITSPAADAGSDQTVRIGEQFILDASNSSDNVRIENYTWNYNGTEYYGEEITHLFSEVGTYQFTLNVTDAAGNYDTDTVTVTVEDQTPPTAISTANRTTVNPGEAIQFDGSNSSDNVNITSYSWEFGDGSTGSGETTTHSYGSAGNYTVTLTVSDAAGNTDTDTLDITVEQEEDTEPPVADAGSDQTVGVGEEFTLNGSGSSDNVGIVNYTWMIEGMEYYSMEITHSFSAVGTYTITLNVTDAAGNYDTDTVTVTVEDQTPPTAVATANQTTVNVGDPIQFDASDSSDNVEIINYSWDFGDGNKGSGETVNHSYESAGNYTVTLTVSDVAGNTDTDTLDFTVKEQDTEPPVAEAGDNKTVDVGENFTIDASASSDNVGIKNYTWTIEGEESHGEQLTYNFSSKGNYTVTLTVEDVAGNTDTDTVNITVEKQQDTDGGDETGGEGGTEPGEEGSGWMMYLIPIILIVIVIAGVLYWRSKESEIPEEESYEEGVEEETAPEEGSDKETEEEAMKEL